MILRTPYARRVERVNRKSEFLFMQRLVSVYLDLARAKLQALEDARLEEENGKEGDGSAEDENDDNVFSPARPRKNAR